MTDDVRGRWPVILDLRDAFRDRLVASERPDEGLRERKKRLMRQHISDMATAMFLERGFDEVRVSEVAAACGVSEKTIYNYFPTKESLLLDREDAMADEIRRVLGPGAERVSPVEATLGILTAEVTELTAYWEAAKQPEMSEIRRFMDLVESTPSLRAAHIDMMERLAQVAATAMAARAGVNPDDPEPQIAADALISLWRIFYRAIRKYSDGTHTPAGVREATLSEVRRAARLIDTGLWSFGMAVQGARSREQLRTAANASNEARKQVLVAIKQARDAWRLIKAELDQHGHDDRSGARREASAQQMRQAAQQAHRAAQLARRDAQRAAHEVRRAAK